MKKFFDITVVILAGGLGTRLRPVIADCPKVLAKIHGKFFLTFILDQLFEWKLNHLVLCTGYQGETIQSVFGETYGDLRILYSQETVPLGTGGALRLAQPLFESDTVLVMNGDSIYYTDLIKFWQWHEECGANASLLLTRVNNVQRFGQVLTDNQKRVLRFEEKNDRIGPGWINAGVYLINTNLIRAIPEHRSVSLEKEVFPSWIDQGFYGFQTEGQFIDIGTPASYAEASTFFSNRLTMFK